MNAHPSGATIGRYPLDPDGPHRAAPMLGRHLGTNEAQAAMMVEAWIKADRLVVVANRDPQQRRERTGVELDNTRRSTLPETTKETFE